ncbi:hypothetical protein [Legionella sp. W05-934-2]|uniref:hypothetical protein n=1 Tax=Legionella sp. W05-934-2 TaxID=1198649 RepID=UPI0034637F70
MLNITRLSHARVIWDQFYQKYHPVSQALNHKRQYSLPMLSQDFLKDIEKNREKYENATIVLQSLWRRIRERDTLIRVNPKGDHSGDFNHLVNFHPKKNPAVRKSLNKRKLDELQQAIEKCDFSASIFDDKTLPQLALSLFDSGTITQQQIYTLLEHHQTIKDYPQIGYFPILNADGAFTSVAKEYLLPSLTNRQYVKGLTTKELEEFRLMIATLPKSEQFFYITDTGKLTTQKNYHQLGHTLIDLDGMMRLKSNHLVHLSAGARDALGLVSFGLRDYIRPMPRLGPMGIDDIEQGVNHRARYAALNFPATKPYEIIHDYKNVNDLEATSHDVYHSNVMSLIPDNFLKILERFVSLTRANTGIKWSIEIWDWVDCDYIYFFHKLGRTPKTNNPKETTALMCGMLEYGNGTSSTDISIGGSLLRDNTPTPLGILVFIDMIVNRPIWLELGIDPSYLTGQYGKYYKMIEQMYDNYIDEKDDIRIQVLKALTYIKLSNSGHLVSFKTINQIINENQQNFVNHLAFNKRPKMNMNKSSNTIEFTCFDQYFTINSLYTLINNSISNPQNTGQIRDTAKHYYASSIIQLGYTKQQALVYTNQKQQGNSESTAQFVANPTLLNWIQDNLQSVALWSFTLVAIPCVLLYGMYQVYQAQRAFNEIFLSINSVNDIETGSIDMPSLTNSQYRFYQPDAANSFELAIPQTNTHSV